MTSLPVVGDRVQIQKDRATVRYVGGVEGQGGLWVGVEWDDASRGKHDGVTGGVRYFSCPEGAGSFIRAEKVSPGVSLLTAIQDRYTNQTAEMGEEVSVEDMYVHTVHDKKVPVLLVGEDRVLAEQRQIQKLTAARIVGSRVSCVVDEGSDSKTLSAILPKLKELDLTCNLISDWGFVEKLCGALPGLQILNLSDNRLALPINFLEEARLSASSSLANLHSIVLNDCVSTTWHEVIQIEPLLSSLTELHMCGNNISSLSPLSMQTEEQEESMAITGFKLLQVLSLEDNNISEWKEVARLSQLPSLTKLILSNNPLKEVVYPVGASVATTPFPSLQTLLLGNCQICAWDSVNEMDHFPSLSELRMSGNPVLQLSKSGGRFEVIGRVVQLTQLNGAKIGPRERRDAEMRYLQNIITDAESVTDVEAKKQFFESHPRMKYLIDTYGQVVVTAARDSGSSIASNMMELKLTCVALSSGSKMGTQVKKLPKSISLGAARQLCEKLFKLKGGVGSSKLFLRDPEDPVPQELTGDDDVALSALGVRDGSEILVDEQSG